MASRLVKDSIFDSKNPIETSLMESFTVLEPKLRPPFPLTIPTKQEYVKLNHAILYAILREPELSKIHIKHLHGVVTDGYKLFTDTLVRIVNELYGKLVDSVKKQVIWVASELVYVCAEGVDGLITTLLRQIVGGDFGEGNLWLCEEMVGVLMLRWEILLEDRPLVLSSGLYVFLRLLADHCRITSNSRMEGLKRKEIEFCMRVLREQFHLCLKIGRDLIRLLQDLVHVPEFRAIWKDLLLNPGSFRTVGFSDISQLYRTRTSTRYFLLRINPEMEVQLRFMLTHVKLGSQKRYQIWFEKKFLSVQESETIVVDIVRFICCGHHPPNEIIFSDITPRWAVIGWLLKRCSKNYVEANVKLALFYDWLFFDEMVDNVMNIEPAILLMINCIPRYADMTNNLLEFLFCLVDCYDLKRENIIIQGVLSAIDVLVRKGVVQSFDVLIQSDMLSPFLKERLSKLLSSKSSISFNDIVPGISHSEALQSSSIPPPPKMAGKTLNSAM